MIYIFIFLLILSAFFSGTETAYFNIRKHRSDTSEKVESILNRPRRLLISLLTGNTIVNVAIASLAAYLTHQYAQEHDWEKYESTLIFIEVLVVSAVVLIFGEILPKMAAIHQSEKFAERVYKPLKIMMSILYPIIQTFNTATNIIMKLLPVRQEKIFDHKCFLFFFF